MARRHNALERKPSIPDNPDGNPSANGSSTGANGETGQSSDETGNSREETQSGLDAATNGNNNTTGANPEVAAGTPGEKIRKERSDKGQKRGPRGSTGARSNPKLGLDKTLLASQIFGLHQIAATVTGQPILMLQPSEATALADRVTDLVGYYGFQPSGPIMLWIGLAATAGAIYLPRLLTIKAMRSSQKPTTEMNPGTSIPKSVVDFGSDTPTNMQ